MSEQELSEVKSLLRIRQADYENAGVIALERHRNAEEGSLISDAVQLLFGLQTAQRGYLASHERAQSLVAELQKVTAEKDAANRLAKISQDNEVRWMHLQEILHVAVCQAVASLNQGDEPQAAHVILRKALEDYADLSCPVCTAGAGVVKIKSSQPTPARTLPRRRDPGLATPPLLRLSPGKGGARVMKIPDINTLPRRPILHTLASKDSWVRVVFYGTKAPTKAEIERTIELLCMMWNGWS